MGVKLHSIVTQCNIKFGAIQSYRLYVILFSDHKTARSIICYTTLQLEPIGPNLQNIDCDISAESLYISTMTTRSQHACQYYFIKMDAKQLKCLHPALIEQQ